MVTHFIASVRPDVLLLWETGFSSWLLYGLTGKFSVAFFFVLLGYFASKPASFNAKAFGSYILRRYFQFAFYIFLCTVIFIAGSYAVTWFFHTPEGEVLRVISDGLKYNVIYLLRDSLLFEDNYNATLWCMQQLFAASLICKGFAFIPEKMSPALRFAVSAIVIILLLAVNAEFFVWVCAAILGYILRLCLAWLETKPGFPQKALVCFSLAAALLLIKLRLNEGLLQYSLQAIAAFLLILAQFNLPQVQRWLSSPPLPWLGGISMGLFVAHTPVYCVFYSSLYPLLCRIMGETPAQLLYFIVSIAACIFCAWLLSRMHTAAVKLFSRKTVSV